MATAKERVGAIAAKQILSTEAEIKIEQWRQRGSRYLRGTGLKSNSKDLVQVDTRALNEAAIDVLEAFAPEFMKAAEKHAIPAAERMVKFWPVFTGASRGLLVFSMQPTDNGDGFEITYESRAPYTTFIHKHRPRNKRPPKVLILDAGNRVVQRMFNELERS